MADLMGMQVWLFWEVNCYVRGVVHDVWYGTVIINPLQGWKILDRVNITPHFVTRLGTYSATTHLLDYSTMDI